ncbi:vacuolar protein sorting-associated protein 35 [Trypanosoma theileri]|uniref:Vacuolar protein sorting-associated protein 35 n=1 Tax=Trypanosoma theileri TaxID=67003 RepID=A0A1X0NXG2_9TRYP|nr:vacuolar protein sorting-associated protein 35 [Trypanosoma theileri]ORC89386.1 vacuolar protein sorting-associated protein 35 [Trypanosoma theileri]
MSTEVPPVNPPNVISIDKPVLTPKQEQEKWLGEAIQAVREKSACMQAYIRQRDFIYVLRTASQMLAELRTGMLAPQYYYELYVKVFDEMQQLEQYFEEEHKRGRSLEEMYEVVQHAGSILPRLYLLITVGSVYIKSGEEPAIEILRDLVEMCKGVQHPTRGLFLRHFLLTMMKNKLPGDVNRTVPSSVEGDGGTVEDTAELILQNFREMNWLWIRMEAKGPMTAEQKQQQQRYHQPATVVQRKHRERKELCVLVGMNIVRLSQLEGVDRQAYKSTILPRLLNIIVSYREPLAQQYLLEVIVQVFPDEFHLFTLEELLNTLENVLWSVDVCAILGSLMERLGNYAVSLREGIAEAGSRKEEKLLHRMFDIFKTRLDAMLTPREEGKGISTLTPPIPSLLEAAVSVTAAETVVGNNRSNGNNNHSSNSNSNSNTNKNNNNNNNNHQHHPFPLISYVKSMLSLIQLSFKADPEAAVTHIGIVLTSITEQVTTPPKEAVVRIIERIIVYVIQTLKDPSVVLDLPSIDILTLKLPFTSRRTVALTLCTTCVQSVSYRITTLEMAARFFELIAPLVKDEPDTPVNRSELYMSSDPTAEFIEEQHLVCRVLHLLHCDDTAIHMKMLNGVRKQLGQGGTDRLVVTLPTLASLYIQFALRVAKEEADAIHNNNNTNNNHNKDGEENGNGTNDDDEGKNEETRKKSKTGVSCAKVFYFIHSGDGKGILEILAMEQPLQTFHLYLASANAADACGLPDVAYEMYVSVFQLYEENAADTTGQIEMMHCLISSLYTLSQMPEESYELLATKVCQYSSKLVRKSDQSSVVALCAHLFWKHTLSSESHQRVLECLKRALKIADSTQASQQLPLFVELLNQVLHYYAGNAPGVTVKYITALIDLVQEASNTKDAANGDGEASSSSNININIIHSNNNSNNSTENGVNEVYNAARTFYRNTTRYIRSRQQVDERWKEIDV